MEDIKKEVWLTICGSASENGEEGGDTSFKTVGTLYRKNGLYYLSYAESELTGLAGTKTTIKISRNGVSVIRTGKLPSTMNFTVGEKQMALYPTPYGQFTVVINTKNIHSTLSENGGKLDVLYEIEVENTPPYQNHLIITVEEKQI